MMRALKEASYVGFVGIIVAGMSILGLRNGMTIGLVILGLGLLPMLGITLSGRKLTSSIPDLIFGLIDTGLLVIPAIAGAKYFGTIGAITGGVVGDAITDAVAGFFEGGVARWLREHGILESRDPITASLGKMAGCLVGGGFVMTLASIMGISLNI
ncbi:MAG: hypothetical protein ABIE70_02840 [bacterium]